MINWIMNAAGLFLTTTGALLIFLYLWRAPRFANDWLSEEARDAYARNRLLLIIAVGLLAAWFLVQCLAVILI